MTRTTNRFEKGSAAYACKCCARTTRSTGRGDNELVKLCAECYDLAGEENHLSDNETFYDKPENVLALIQAVVDKGGNASCWDHLKATALNMVAPKEEPKVVEVTSKPEEIQIKHMLTTKEAIAFVKKVDRTNSGLFAIHLRMDAHPVDGGKVGDTYWPQGLSTYLNISRKDALGIVTRCLSEPLEAKGARICITEVIRFGRTTYWIG